MSQKRDSGLRFVAWPGLSVDAPANWDVAELGKGYLRLEREGPPDVGPQASGPPDSGPLASGPSASGQPQATRPADAGRGHAPSPWTEFRWERIRPPFSADKQLRRLGKAFPRVRFDAMRPGRNNALLHAAQALSARGLECTPFNWNATPEKGATASSTQPPDGRDSGHGLIAYSPAHELALVCQTNAPESGPEMIASARLYGAADLMPVNVFGLSARIPGSYRLDDFSFKPGHFRLVFRSTERGWLGGEKRVPDTRLVLDRVGPASVALKATPLSDWVEGLLKDLHLSQGLRREETPDRVVWLRASRSARKPACMVLARLDRETNKILCITAQGKTLPTEKELRTLESAYGTL